MLLPLQTWALLILLAIGFYLLWQIPYPQKSRQEAEKTPRPRSLSVIIAATNGEHNVGRLLATLQQGGIASDQVLVVAGGRADANAYAAREFDAEVLPAESVPEGWTPKCWACWEGALHADGELLLFLDADAWLEPDGMARLIGTWEDGKGLLSVEPYHQAALPHEQLPAILDIVAMAGTNAFTPRGFSIPPNGASGACLVTDRLTYFEVGGHAQESVRGHALEGIPLARAYLERGLPVRCYGGRGSVSIARAEGLRWWSEVLLHGAASVRWPYLLGILGWLVGCWGALADLVGSLVSLDPLEAIAGALVYVLCAGQIAWMLSRIGRYRWWAAWAFPLPLLFSVAALLTAITLPRGERPRT